MRGQRGMVLRASAGTPRPAKGGALDSRSDHAMANSARRDGLDDELAAAAGLGSSADGSATTVGGSATTVGGSPPVEPYVFDPTEGAMAVSGRPGRPAPARKGGSFGLLATLLVMAAGLVALFMFGFKDAAVYSVPVDKLLADQFSVGKRVRIDGELVPGSLSRRDKPCEWRFKIQGEGKELEIRYPQCVIPDTFRDVPQGGVMVTAEGKLLAGGHFEASLILAKCSSKYDPKTHEMGAPAASGSPDAI